MSQERLRMAQNFLQEAVYQSRARQASAVEITAGSADSTAGCGLGSEAAIDLELSPNGEELFHKLWPRTLAPTELARIETIRTDWVERQDALDRKRNHFLRDFRKTHGFDRRAYPEDVAGEFEQGLEKINEEVSDGLRKAAEELLKAD